MKITLSIKIKIHISFNRSIGENHYRFFGVHLVPANMYSEIRSFRSVCCLAVGTLIYTRCPLQVPVLLHAVI